MKDNFSTASDLYAKYRPSYPAEFFEYLYSLLPYKLSAWDCGTGTGQIASVLSKGFQTVYATDISQTQIDHAIKAKNIHYSLQAAETTNFPNRFFDLIIVAQAIHWFEFEKFYAEVNRTAKERAIICVIGYGRIKISAEIDAMITDFYTRIIGRYWDQERRYIDERYATIPFPFKEIKTPMFSTKYDWTLEHLQGYLNTWSAVKHFIKQEEFNPVDHLIKALKPQWKYNESKKVTFPILLRIGQLK